MSLSKLKKSKVNIKPTWRVWLSLLVVGIALFAAVNYDTSVLNWFVYSLLFVFVGMMVYTQFALANIEHKWSYKKHIFKDETFDPNLEITGAEPYGIVFENSDFFNAQKKLPVGVHTLKGLSLFTEYPFGYFKAIVPLSDLGPVWVYPKPIEYDVESQSSKSTNPSDLFRPYRPGDSPRRVLKKTMTLPHSKWQSKRDHSEATPQTSETELNWFALGENLTASQKLEHLSYMINNMKDNQVFSLILPNKRIVAGKGNAHKHNAWRALAETWTLLNITS